MNLAIRRMHRQIGRHHNQAQAINKDLLNKMLKATEANLRGIRDRALLQVAYDSLCRRSEIVTLRFEDIKITHPENSDTPSVSILLRRSKTDQDAQGRWLYIRLATWQAIQEWISASAAIRCGLEQLKTYYYPERAYRLLWRVADGLNRIR